MPSENILLLGSESRQVLMEELRHAGFDPTVCNRHPDAIQAFGTEDVVGIMVDAKTTDVDVLEFVLDVRDIDLHVPVAVLVSGLPKKDRAILGRVPNTFLMSTRPNIKAGVKRFSKFVQIDIPRGGTA